MSSEAVNIYETDSDNACIEYLEDELSKDQYSNIPSEDTFNIQMMMDEPIAENCRKESSSSNNSDEDPNNRKIEEWYKEDIYAIMLLGYSDQHNGVFQNDLYEHQEEARLLDDPCEVCDWNSISNEKYVPEDTIQSTDMETKTVVIYEDEEKESMEKEHEVITVEQPNEAIIQEEKPKATKKFIFQAPSGSICDVCSKTVYPMEKVMMDLKCYHKNCFKCCKCGKSMNPTVVTMSNNKIFCKPHYIELFRKRGRYDDINANSQDDFDKSAIASSSYYIPKNNNASQEHNNSNRKDSRSYSDVPRRVSDANERVILSDLESSGKVANVARAWIEGRVSNSNSWRKENSNNNSQENEDNTRSNSGSRIKNLKAIFESNHV